MKLDAAAKKYLQSLSQAGIKPSHRVGWEAARLQQRAIDREISVGPALPYVEDIYIDEHVSRVSIRLYKPSFESPLPCCIYLHGGGWVSGGIDSDDAICRQISRSSGIAVAAVDWRRAPEFAFPIPHYDVLNASRWLVKYSRDLGIDPLRFGVMGRCVGGNLAVGLQRLIALHGGPKIACQALLAPQLSAVVPDAALWQCEYEQDFTRSEFEWNWACFLTEQSERYHPLASPLLADDLYSMAPALVISAGFDLCSSSAQEFSRKLCSFGIEVSQMFLPGMIHNFLGATAIVESAAFLEQHLKRPLGHGAVHQSDSEFAKTDMRSIY